MKITVNKTAFGNIIGYVMGACANRGTNAALECVMIKAAGNMIELTTYDNSKGIKATCEAVVEEEGGILIKGERLSTITKNMPSGEFTIETDERNTVSIYSGRTKFEVAGLPYTSFPLLPTLVTDKTFTLSQGQLKKLLSMVMFSFAQTDIKPILTGVLFELEEKLLKICSCDGYRVSLCKEIVPVPEELSYTFIVPGKTLIELYRLMKDGEEKIKITIAPKHVAFYFNDIMMFSRKLDGSYIDYESTFQKVAATTAIVDLEALSDSVDRSALILDEKVKKGIKVIFSEDSVKINCETANGKINEEVPAIIEGEEVLLGMNQKYLSEALRAAVIAGEEKVVIKIRSNIHGVMILPEDNDSFTYMVLPLRL